MLLPTDTYIERSKFYLLQPIMVPANRNCRDCMTELVIGRKSELHACPAISFPTSPSITSYTLHNRIVIFLIYSAISRRIIYWQVDVGFERVAP